MGLEQFNEIFGAPAISMPEYIPTGFEQLDKMLNNKGFRRGTTAEVFGHDITLLQSIALQVCAEERRLIEAGRKGHIVFLDFEQNVKDTDLSVFDLISQHFELVQPTVNTNTLKEIIDLVANKTDSATRPSLIIVSSFSAIRSKFNWQDQKNFGQTIDWFINKITQALRNTNTTLIVLNQTRPDDPRTQYLHTRDVEIPYAVGGCAFKKMCTLRLQAQLISEKSNICTKDTRYIKAKVTVEKSRFCTEGISTIIDVQQRI